MWSPNELLKIEKQRDILSYITLQFFHFKKVPLEHCPFFLHGFFFLKGSAFFGRPPNWVSHEGTVHWTVPSPVLILSKQKSFKLCGARPKVSPLESDKLLKKLEQNF